MADNSKYNGSTWDTGFTGIRKTATETLSLPQTIYADGTAATLSIKGNTVQNGTPTPSAPVDIVGVGELETTGEHAGEYKIPISSPVVTTNIDLGSTQTVRQVKKLVLTSRSDVDNIFAYNGVIYVQKSGMLAELNAPFCNCLVGTVLPAADAPANSVKQLNITGQAYPAALLFKIDGITATAGFENFLAEMNSAGTPVTIWYVLATPETAAVNEPLMKIGTYADSISGISIPTTDGANTITVDTTVQPSEVSATYTGWHDSSVKEWDGTDWT